MELPGPASGRPDDKLSVIRERPGSGDASLHRLRATGYHREKRLLLFSHRGEQIAAPPHGADDAGVSRVGLDLAPDAHDPDVDSPIERLGVARIGEFEQAFAGEHPFRVFGKRSQQAIFRGGQRILVALLVAKRAPIHIEPFGAETNEIPGWRYGPPHTPRRTAPHP